MISSKQTYTTNHKTEHKWTLIDCHQNKLIHGETFLCLMRGSPRKGMDWKYAYYIVNQNRIDLFIYFFFLFRFQNIILKSFEEKKLTHPANSIIAFILLCM